MKERVSIIIPTYNEAGGIGSLLESLENEISTIPWEITIVIADDHSPDGTAHIVQDLGKTYDNLMLLSGPREGMGAAYIRALSTVLDSCDIVITMDADLSHPPDMIPQLLQKMDTGCDMVIGSRYIPGGGTVNWPLWRRITSTLANCLARYIAGLSTVKDCTSNYRAIRTAHLASIPFSPLDAGYAFVTTVLWAVHRKGTICEIPLLFHDRKKGKTKLRMKDLLFFFINCFRLRFLSLYAFFRPSIMP
jgi:dolichol-phosphate mannosyltransferase